MGKFPVAVLAIVAAGCSLKSGGGNGGSAAVAVTPGTSITSAGEAEIGAPIPKEPILFMKAVSALTGPNDEVIIPRGSVKTDWEVELGVVIGKRGEAIVVERLTACPTIGVAGESETANGPGPQSPVGTATV